MVIEQKLLIRIFRDARNGEKAGKSMSSCVLHKSPPALTSLFEDLYFID